MEFTLRSNREKRHVTLSFTLDTQREKPLDVTLTLPKNVLDKMNEAWFRAQPLMYGNWNGIF